MYSIDRIVLLSIMLTIIILSNTITITLCQIISTTSTPKQEEQNQSLSLSLLSSSLSSPIIKGLYLVDVRTQKDLYRIKDGMIIDTKFLGTTELTIRADISLVTEEDEHKGQQQQQVEYIEFNIDHGLTQRIDYTVPYVVAGKNAISGKMYSSTLFTSLGNHTITIIPKVDSSTFELSLSSSSSSYGGSATMDTNNKVYINNNNNNDQHDDHTIISVAPTSIITSTGTNRDYDTLIQRIIHQAIKRNNNDDSTNTRRHQRRRTKEEKRQLQTIYNNEHAITIQFEIVHGGRTNNNNNKDIDNKSLDTLISSSYDPNRITTPTDVLPYQSSMYGTMNGQFKIWNKITIAFDGPDASEIATSLRDISLNEGRSLSTPFADYRVDVTFVHEVTNTKLIIPGYFTITNDPANIDDNTIHMGGIWICHFVPNMIGTWIWSVSFVKGGNVAPNGGIDTADYFHGTSGTINIIDTNDAEENVDLANNLSIANNNNFKKGRLQYVNNTLRFVGSGETLPVIKNQYDLSSSSNNDNNNNNKNNILAFSEFDNSVASESYNNNLDETSYKMYAMHYNKPENSTTWKNGKGKNLIGYINYLVSKGINMLSVTTLSIGDHGINVHGTNFVSPFRDYNQYGCMVYDVSKLAQWGIIFEYAVRQGLVLRIQLHDEMENSAEIFDNDGLYEERKLYYREMIARFGYNLHLIWDLGPITRGVHDDEIHKWITYIHSIDPYSNPIIVNGNYI